MSSKGLTADGMCARYGPSLEWMWKDLRPTSLTRLTSTYGSDTAIQRAGDEDRDLLEDLVSWHQLTLDIENLKHDPSGDADELHALRANEDRIRERVEAALDDEMTEERLVLLTLAIRERTETT